MHLDAGKGRLMHGRSFRLILPGCLLLASACGSASQLTLPAPPVGQPTAEVTGGAQVPVETAVIVPGTPTAVYALVARGALQCWFGADGPLKPTHVFEAEAEPPAKGGGAEITLYERDEALRDKRGARALRVAIASSSDSVRVGTTVIRLDPQTAQHMVKDVEIWARGGSGCELRAHMQPSPAPVQEASKGKTGSPGGKKR
jgi:hypothetical protein